MPNINDTNQTGRALQIVTVPDLELRMAAFLSAQAAGYDLVERGTGRRITFDRIDTPGELYDENQDSCSGPAQAGRNEGAPTPAVADPEQRSLEPDTVTEPLQENITSAATTPRAAEVTPPSAGVPAPAGQDSAHPAGAEPPTAPARSKRGKALHPKRRETA